jgi:membrane associated rhomboid family serine protease
MFRSNLFSYTITKLALVSVLMYFLQLATNFQILEYLSLNPYYIVTRGFIWQIVTYIFLHGSPMHLLVNMYVLVMFGIQVEEVLGSGKMLFYFFFCGIGAGFIIFVIGFLQLINAGAYTATIGASGAVFGILIAFAFFFPDSIILLFFVIPVKAKYLVLVYVMIEVYFYLSGTGGNVSYVGHLGGVFFALLYFLIWGKERAGFITKFKQNLKSKKVEKEKKAELLSENQVKKDILKKLNSGYNLSDLTDDEYQFVKHFSVIYEDSIKTTSSLLKKDEITDHEFISAVRYITKDESL